MLYGANTGGGAFLAGFGPNLDKKVQFQIDSGRFRAFWVGAKLNKYLES